MRISLYILFIFIFKTACAQDHVKNGIQFRDMKFDEALVAAKKEGKPVFIHCYASWCHYCMFMSDSVYPDSSVGAYYNEHFICIKVDLEKEGAELNKKLKAHTYPTLVFFNAEGEVLHRAAGRHYKWLFLELGKEAIDPRRQLRTWLNIYNSGNVSADTAYQVLRKIEIAGMETQEPLLQYLNRLKQEEITKPENWKIINELFKDVQSSFMKTIIAEKPELEKLYTKRAVNDKLFSIYTFEFYMLNRLLDSTGYDALKQKVKAERLDIGDMICDYADMSRFKAASKYDEYMELAPHFVKSYCMDNVSLLYETAHFFYEKTSDKEKLTSAVKWMRRAVELEDSYNNNLLLCGLFVQLKNKAEARQVVDHAIALAKEKNISNRTALLLIDKIEQIK